MESELEWDRDMRHLQKSKQETINSFNNNLNPCNSTYWSFFCIFGPWSFSNYYLIPFSSSSQSFALALKFHNVALICLVLGLNILPHFMTLGLSHTGLLLVPQIEPLHLLLHLLWSLPVHYVVCYLSSIRLLLTLPKVGIPLLFSIHPLTFLNHYF